MNERERDDVCPYCGSEMIWVGSIMSGALECPYCIVDDSDLIFDEDEEKGPKKPIPKKAGPSLPGVPVMLDINACPECGKVSRAVSTSAQGALICTNLNCNVIAFRLGTILTRRTK